MIQFLNSIWITLNTENATLIQILVFPLRPIESILMMYLFLIIFNVKSSFKQKTSYVVATTIVGFITANIIPSPFNIIINYVFMLALIKIIFKLSWFKSFISLILPVFIVVLLNALLQRPYIALLNIDADTYMNTPIYRIPYLLFVYSLVFIICIVLNNIKSKKFVFDYIDNLDKKTRMLLSATLFFGFFTLLLQLITTAFYIDIVPISINILNFILLVLFLVLCVFNFTRVLELSITKQDLASAENYNKSLETLYDRVKGFKHDSDNIISTLDGYIENNDMAGLKKYFNEIKKDCKITNNLSIINPTTINNPGIYNLLNNKYFKAVNLGINFEFEYFLDLNKLDVNLYQLSRILGILIDNAIEEAEKCKNKTIKISFLQENRNNRAVISIKNTYINKDVNIDEIFDKGVSGKDNHSGIGLWQVRKYIKKCNNLDLFTSKNDQFFQQELSIYNI